MDDTKERQRLADIARLIKTGVPPQKQQPQDIADPCNPNARNDNHK